MFQGRKTLTCIHLVFGDILFYASASNVANVGDKMLGSSAREITFSENSVPQVFPEHSREKPFLQMKSRHPSTLEKNL